MKDVVKILIERDGMTCSEAVNLVLETREMINEAFECGDDPDEIIQDMLGLEPDYIMSII